MDDKLSIARNWLPRYTGMPVDSFGESILLTNFANYVESFCDRFSCDLYGEGRPMQAATNSDGVSIINFGIGSPNAATVMDLLSARDPRGVLFLGKCGGLKTSSEIGHFIHGKIEPFARESRVEVHSPYSGEEVGRIPVGRASAIDAALSSAVGAFIHWRSTPISTRFELLEALQARIEDEQGALAELLVLEIGKTQRYAKKSGAALS